VEKFNLFLIFFYFFIFGYFATLNKITPNA
jgi:hypothetical protein